LGRYLHAPSYRPLRCLRHRIISLCSRHPGPGRYDNTGYCQIWDDGVPLKPLKWPSDYKLVAKPVPTLAAAMSERDVLIKKGKCRGQFLP
jgi:hypothetical protein